MNEHDKEKQFIDNVKKALDLGAENLDAGTLSKLTRMRHQALDAGERKGFDIRQWFTLPEPSEDEPEGHLEMDSLGASLRRRFPQADITAATAAFGTYSMMSVLDSLAARPDGQSMPETGEMVYPQSAEWRDAVWHSAIVVIQRALTGLHSP